MQTLTDFGSAALAPSTNAPKSDLTRLVLLGTPFPAWLGLAEAVRTALQTTTILTDAIGVHKLEVALFPNAFDRAGTPVVEDGDARFIVFVDSPQRVLANWLRLPCTETPEQALREWHDGGRRLLRHLHALRTQCLCVNAEEASAAPDALWLAITSWLGTHVAAPVAWPIAAIDEPIGSLLAWHLVRGDLRLSSLYSELNASCSLLNSANSDFAEHNPQILARSASEALSIYRQELTRTAALVRQSGEPVTVQLPSGSPDGGSPAELPPETSTVAPSGREAETKLEETSLQLGSLQIERDLLLAQMRHMQQELKAAFVAVRTPELATSASIDGSNTTCRKVGSMRPLGASGGPVEVFADSIRISHCRDESPHRELHLEITGLRVPGKAPRPLMMRLIEHNGRPGMAVLSTPGQVELLSFWRQSGQEAERSFMLLIPSDDEGRRNLYSLGTTDWLTVERLAQLCTQAVSTSSMNIGPHWSAIASRLVRQLAGLAPKLRYDAVEFGQADANGRLDFSLLQVMFDRQIFARVDLSCQARAKNGIEANALEWRLGVDALPPLAGWPHESGTASLQSSLRLPVGTSLGRSERRRWWADLLPSDRAIVFALLEALPSIAEQASDDAPLGGVKRQDLLLLFDSWYKQARRTLELLQLRQSLRNALRPQRLHP